MTLCCCEDLSSSTLAEADAGSVKLNFFHLDLVAVATARDLHPSC